MSRRLSLATVQAMMLKVPTTFSSTVITAATNVQPIAVTSTAHGLATGDSVLIQSVLGNTAANGISQVTVTGPNTFTIPQAGNGAYTSGGTVAKVTIGTQLGNLLPGDLRDLNFALEKIMYIQGGDLDRTVESTLAAIFATSGKL